MNVKTRLASAVFAALLLAACGSRLTGTYTDPMGIASYTFQSNGKVEMNAMGTAMELKYEVHGNKVKFVLPGGSAQVLTIQPDGSISGPGGIRLTRKD